MADGKSKGLSPDSGDVQKDILKAIEDTLRHGRIPEGLVIPADEETQKKLREILSDIVATQQFALAMAQGDLSQDLAVKGHMAGSLKALQSSLRHLTWQAGQIAGGDLSQRVHFMGEFADSFNAMVEHLAEDEINRNVREEELRRVNTALAGEVAERKTAEEALRQANRKLNLLSGITRHDIKNQLMILSGYLELSKRSLGDAARTSELIEKEKRTAETLSRLINFTKDYEDLGVKSPAWQNVFSLIEKVISLLPVRSIRVDAGNPTLEVFADPLLEKVFYNLFDNALRYGGEQMTAIRITHHDDHGNLVIVVQDDGSGISAEDKLKLFTKGFGKNTGLGLFLSREILSITGITITETGEPGKGARFEILVPEEGYRLSVGN